MSKTYQWKLDTVDLNSTKFPWPEVLNKHPVYLTPLPRTPPPLAPPKTASTRTFTEIPANLSPQTCRVTTYRWGGRNTVWSIKRKRFAGPLSSPPRKTKPTKDYAISKTSEVTRCFDIARFPSFDTDRIPLSETWAKSRSRFQETERWWWKDGEWGQKRNTYQ